jgi:hypothetical protein
MRMKIWITFTLGIMLIAAWAQPGNAASNCDRTCLTGVLDHYLAALVAKEPSKAPWAKVVKFTENNVSLKIGDGLWGTISGIQPSADLKFVDPANGEVGYYGVVEEHGNPAYLALRLKVVDRKIAEVETIVSRKGDGPGAPHDFLPLNHDPAFFETIPATERTPRTRLIELADGYFSTLQRNDGTLHTEFDPTCARLEDGGQSAGAADAKNPNRVPCAEQFKLGFFRWDDRVRDRSFVLVDEERGLVMARAFIDHSGVLTDYILTNGEKKVSPIKAPHTWCMLELFKIKGGKMYRIEAVFIPVPYYMPSPWVHYSE